MNCSCVYTGGDFSEPKLYNRTNPKAQKNHTCSECGRTIIKSELYCCETMLYDGCFDKYKTCIDCVSIRDKMFCEGWHYGEIMYDLKEYIHSVEGNISEKCMLALTRSARLKVAKIIDDEWGND